MIRRIAVLFTLLAFSGAASAEEWTGSVTLYGWLPAMETSTTVERHGSSVTADVSTGAGEILDALNFGFFGAAEARRGRLGLFGDIFYSDLGVKQTSDLGVKQNVATNLFMFTGAASWRVWDNGSAYLDGFGGGRVVTLESDVTAGAASASSSVSYFDPIFGARAGYAVTDAVSLMASGNIGGFGVGSEFTWEAYAGFSYAFNERVSTELGYRYLSIDYESGATQVDMQMFGPVAALTIHF